MTKPLCFVLMPFGTKRSTTGHNINFDRVYSDVIEPAVEEAGLAPLRADQEEFGGVIHKAMFERLLLCPYSVADLSAANANVYYELGIRHAARPRSTVLIHCNSERLPFDVAPDRSLPYSVDTDGIPEIHDEPSDKLSRALTAVVGRDDTDSPIHEMLDWIQPQVTAHERTEIFREQLQYSEKKKSELREARESGLQAIWKIERDLGPFAYVETGVLIDLLLSYRAVEAWDEMIRLVNELPTPVSRTTLVREQYGFALNRAGDHAAAEHELTSLIQEKGASSETLGILGRVYKDRWQNALENRDDLQARAYLDKAIETYKQGFQTDFRDSYPGLNALTLMDCRSPGDAPKQSLLPVVEYAVDIKMARGSPDYWDHASKLELGILKRDSAQMNHHLGQALISVREAWEPKTTAGNIAMIRDARRAYGEPVTELDDVIEQLDESR